MNRITKIALAIGAALGLGLAAGMVNAHPEGGWGGGYGMGYGNHMGYGPGSHMGFGPGNGRGPGYGMGPGNGRGAGYGMGGFGMGGLANGGPERLDALKSDLAITDKQLDAWNGFADSVQKQAEGRRAWFEKMHESAAPGTTVDRLTLHTAFMKAQQAYAEAVTASLGKLYEVLTPEQRAKLDRGPIAMGPGGGRGCL